MALPSRISLPSAPSDRRPVVVVQHPLGEVGGGHKVLQALLVLDADGVAAEGLRDTGRSDIHPALVQDLVERQIGGRVGAEMERHPLLDQPFVDGAGFRIGDIAGSGVERGLRQAFLEHAEREQKLVRDDRVVHPHAAFVENAHDRFALAEVAGDRARDLAGPLRRRGRVERADMGSVVGDAPLAQPLTELVLERLVGEGLAPQGAVWHAGFGQRSVQVEHSDEARPLPGPVRHRENRAAMADEPRQDVVGILPDCFGDDDRRLRINAGEDFEALLLAGDESMLESRIIGMGALDFDAERGQRGGDLLLHSFLRRPAGLVGALPQVAARRHQDFFSRGHGRASHQCVCRQTPLSADRRSRLGHCFQGVCRALDIIGRSGVYSSKLPRRVKQPTLTLYAVQAAWN